MGRGSSKTVLPNTNPKLKLKLKAPIEFVGGNASPMRSARPKTVIKKTKKKFTPNVAGLLATGLSDCEATEVFAIEL